MSRSKKIFLIIAVVFIGLLLYASFDIGSRTTFPGSKSQLKERLKQRYGNDTLKLNDSIKNSTN
jgi:hypothetical protein